MYQNPCLIVGVPDAYNYTTLSFWIMFKTIIFIHIMLNHSLIQVWLGLLALPSILILLMTCWILFGFSATWIIIILESLKDQSKPYKLIILLIHLLVDFAKPKSPWFYRDGFIHSRISLAAKYYISKSQQEGA